MLLCPDASPFSIFSHEQRWKGYRRQGDQAVSVYSGLCPSIRALTLGSLFDLSLLHFAPICKSGTYSVHVTDNNGQTSNFSSVGGDHLEQYGVKLPT
jgi:hypothetical protein